MIRKGDILANLIDSETGQWETYEKVTTLPDGTPLDDTIVENLTPIYRKSGDEYFRKTSTHTRPVSVTEFGAKGDGSSDDVQSIQAAIDYVGAIGGGEVIIPPGTYKFNEKLQITGSRVRVLGISAKIIPGVQFGPNDDIITITGSNCSFEGDIEIDGLNLIEKGLQISGPNSTVRGITIHSVYGLTSSGVGIGISCPSAVGTTISGNRIRNISANPNAILGDAPGAARAIVINASQDNPGTGVIIDGNHISEITGEEGDGIQLLFAESGVLPYHKAFSVISNNIIHNCNRRHIKVQACDVIVDGNICSNDLTIEQTPNAITCISAILGDNITITNNQVDARVFVSGIRLMGDAEYKITGGIVSNNIIISGYERQDQGDWTGRETQSAIMLIDTHGTNVQGNNITGSVRGIRVLDSNYTTVSGNNFYDTSEANNRILIDGDSENCYVYGNSGSAAPGVRSIQFVNISGPGHTIINNRAIYPGQNYNIVRMLEGCEGCFISGNESESVGLDISDTSGGNNYFGTGINKGTGNSLTKGVYFGSEAPTGGNWSRGDIMFYDNPLGGSVLGWRCISGGSPGTWASMDFAPREVETQFSGLTINLSSSPRARYQDISTDRIYSLSGSNAGRPIYVQLNNTDSSAHTFTINGANFPAGTVTEIPAGGYAVIMLITINAVVSGEVKIYT